MGNEKLNIKELLTFNLIRKELTGHHVSMSTSHAELVRCVVYDDARESWFSPSLFLGKASDFLNHAISRQA